MRTSTRRTISRAAVVGLLSTTPLISGWTAPDRDTGSVSELGTVVGASDVDALEPVHLTAFDASGTTWRDVAPTVDETLRIDEHRSLGDEVGTGLTPEQLDSIDTSGVTVTFLRDEQDVGGDESDAGGDQSDAGEDESDAGDEQPSAYVTADGEEVTAERIHAFLDDRNAPLADQADAILAAGITHDVDPRVIVGIAIAESNGGERLPAGSHNAWGWGGSGDFGLAHWASWDDALDIYAERLGALYDTDNVDESFARTYCPPNWRWWLDTVTWTIDQI